MLGLFFRRKNLLVNTFEEYFIEAMRRPRIAKGSQEKTVDWQMVSARKRVQKRVPGEPLSSTRVTASLRLRHLAAAGRILMESQPSTMGFDLNLS